ncbi:GSCOCG00008993001-RA-CDS [Cotesia congregata]|uniref:Cilia- and flagella-associated protein 36 n=1 Tax=Cotesia congregata TaxID=51543 RepID=A0A8J2HPK5_COTCN|nr:GSCOCG00012773001-RA-CDS [Cotesia congregata]CAD6240907.1 GSCOCG00008993001-RA-CDS [Cotesia congregata]CAG5108083.1 Similar to CFAP36: Cilia- and flagella-associated protein 36 (Homo sapiens) [Cotesia congregata]
MAQEDSGWVFDSLVGFLQGPVWSAPLLTFIEERSLIFEADTQDSEEYHEVYQEYKNLVDLLLGCYMEDMRITPEQFEHACTVNKQTRMPINFQQSLFEQIWAANEYEIFKRMMIQKNLELQLQALNMLEQKFGLTPSSLTYNTEDLPDDELAMEEILQKKIQELEQEEDDDNLVEAETDLEKAHEILYNQYQNERAVLEETIRTSAQLTDPPVKSVENVDQPIESSSKSVKLPLLKPTRILTPLAPIPKEEDEKPDLQAETKINEKQDESEEDMKKRENYLKARRDKLVALKKQARNQRLEMTKARPSSARNVAEATMQGKQDLENSQATDPSILQVRKALAARLRAEVVHQ